MHQILARVLLNILISLQRGPLAVLCEIGRILCLLVTLANWSQVLKFESNSFFCLFLVSIYREKAMAPHSSTLAWEIQWTGEPGRLQSMGLLGVGHD